MRIYLAAYTLRAEEMRRVRDRLVAMGHVVTSRWIDKADLKLERATTPGDLTDRPEPYREAASECLADLRAAEVLVAFTGEGGRGGRHVEFGYALARRMRILIVGPREHLFHTMAVRYATTERFLEDMYATVTGEVVPVAGYWE